MCYVMGACTIKAERRFHMENAKNSKGTPTKRTGAQNRINLDYDFNSDFGDGDIPDIDKNKASDSTTNVKPDDIPRRDGPGGD